MKRKLDENNKPIIVSKPSRDSVAATTPGESAAPSNFSDLGLDSRLLRAIALQKYHAPTLVQSKVVPLALNGQDILAKAKTGSGKTAAYLLPLLHVILKRKQVCFGLFLLFVHSDRR